MTDKPTCAQCLNSRGSFVYGVNGELGTECHDPLGGSNDGGYYEFVKEEIPATCPVAKFGYNNRFLNYDRSKCPHRRTTA